MSRDFRVFNDSAPALLKGVIPEPDIRLVLLTMLRVRRNANAGSSH